MSFDLSDENVMSIETGVEGINILIKKDEASEVTALFPAIIALSETIIHLHKPDESQVKIFFRAVNKDVCIPINTDFKLTDLSNLIGNPFKVKMQMNKQNH